MNYEWDKNKNDSNQIKHQLKFEDAAFFEWQCATHEPDMRKDYGEPRMISFAPLHERVCALLWTPRGETIRIIGLRKANKREVKRYDNKT